MTFFRLLQAYQSPRAAWAASDAEWRAAKLARPNIETAGHRQAALAWAVDQVRKLAKSPWTMSTYGDDRYPAALSSLRDPPPFLFMRGQVPAMPAIAVVGSRQSTPYGLNVTEQIAGELAAHGVVIVSGFARGIDAAAHKAALSMQGATVAVWGCGPDVIYPRENRGLIPRILEHGAIITEFAFGAAPERQNFPVRNRLIAGLSAGVLVVQAGSRSGALLTAQHAVEQGKDVYGIPGEIGRPHAEGVNELIKAGAKIVTTAADILIDLGIRTRTGGPQRRAGCPAELPPMSPLEERVCAGLGGSPCHLDRLAVSLGVSAAECAAVLVSLQLKGVVRQEPGNMFSRLI
jgi:DNA processing protein